MQHEATKITSIHHLEDSSEKNEKDGLPMRQIRQWKTQLFNEVANRLCDQRLLIVQRTIGAWKTDVPVRLPYRNEVTVLGDGPMCIKVHMAEDRHEVDMQISVHLSDVKVSIRVPREVLSKGTGLTNVISECLTGHLCDVVRNERQGNIFEWSFKENGVADKGLMLSSISDPVYASLLADSISNIVSNIFMSVISVLAAEGVDLAENEAIGDNHSKQLVSDITRLPFHHHTFVINTIRNHGFIVEGVYPQPPNRLLMLLSFDGRQEEFLKACLHDIANQLDAVTEIHAVRKLG